MPRPERRLDVWHDLGILTPLTRIRYGINPCGPKPGWQKQQQVEHMVKANTLLRVLGMVAVATVAGPALAHTEGGAAGGFVTGFLHPILGWDHVAAMVAVGLWGAFLGPPAIWLLPVTFPLVMALGAVAGAAGVPLPGIETGIAASALVIGLAVALAARPPLWIAAVIVAVFAVFHGHAHGTEMPNAISPLAYAAGFVIGTGLLHLAGIALGSLTRTAKGTVAVRAAGAAIAAAGVGFLTGAI
jgi:urease accessory protein